MDSVDQNICPECNERPCYGPKAKSCRECLPGRKQRQAAEWKARNREQVREIARKRYRRQTGGRDPGKRAAEKVERPEWMADFRVGVLPFQIQAVPAERMEDAIQRILDADRQIEFLEKLKAGVHEAVAKVRQRTKRRHRKAS